VIDGASHGDFVLQGNCVEPKMLTTRYQSN